MATKKPAAEKGTVLCSMTGERVSSKHVIYVRRHGYAHRDPVFSQELADGKKPRRTKKKEV